MVKHQLVHYGPTLGSKSAAFEFVQNGELQFIAMRGNVTVNNSDSYTAACLPGFGIAQIPRTGAENYLAERKLVEILSDFRAEPMPVSLLYANRRNLPRRV